MFKLIRVTWVPVVLVLSACDVQVRDETAAEYPANHDIGMYDIKATVKRDALVTPGSVFLFALGQQSEDSAQPGGLRVSRVVFGALSEQLPAADPGRVEAAGAGRAPQAGAAATPADQTGRAGVRLIGEFRLRGQGTQGGLAGERAVPFRDGAERADHRGACRALERGAGGRQVGQGHLGPDAASGRGGLWRPGRDPPRGRPIRTHTARWPSRPITRPCLTGRRGWNSRRDEWDPTPAGTQHYGRGCAHGVDGGRRGHSGRSARCRGAAEDRHHRCGTHRRYARLTVGESGP